MQRPPLSEAEGMVRTANCFARATSSELFLRQEHLKPCKEPESTAWPRSAVTQELTASLNKKMHFFCPLPNHRVTDLQHSSVWSKLESKSLGLLAGKLTAAYGKGSFPPRDEREGESGVQKQQWEGFGFVWLLQCHMCRAKSRRSSVSAHFHLPIFNFRGCLREAGKAKALETCRWVLSIVCRQPVIRT